MKKMIGVAALAASCFGCASGMRGFHTVKLDISNYNYKTETMELVPVFKVENPKPVIAEQGRNKILGKWRVTSNTDSLCYIDRSNPKFFGGSSTWHIDEYEFRDDGTYSERRIDDDCKTVLNNQGVDGMWSYKDGILQLQKLCFISPGVFVFSNAKRTEEKKGAKIDHKVLWHSENEFVLQYVDFDWLKKAGAAMGGTTTYRYDDKGCRHDLWYDGKTGLSTVSNPMRFKRVGK